MTAERRTGPDGRICPDDATEERMYRHGLHLMREAISLGWPDDGGKGAMEFVDPATGLARIAAIADEALGRSSDDAMHPGPTP